jgi:hypothetical protein
MLASWVHTFGWQLRRRPTVWDLIFFAGFVAGCLVIVPFLIAFERMREYRAAA